MNKYEITYTVGTDYVMTVEAEHVGEAVRVFESIYKKDQDELRALARELEVTHDIRHIAKASA